jgi:PAS domain S-box-containing protein
MRKWMRKLAGYGVAVALVALATLLTMCITPVRLRSPYLLFTIAVMGSAAWGGFGAGIFSVLLSGLAALYVLIEPVYTFRMSDPEDLIPLVLFGFVGIAITYGVTLLIQARQQAEESRERFHTAFADSHIGLVRVDAQGSVIEVNRAFREITGYNEQELRGRHLRDLIHPEDVPESLRLFNQLVSREIPSVVHEKRYVRKDGTSVWARVSAAGVRGVGGAPNEVIKLVEDITQAKRLELELQQAQKMEAVGRLAGGVAHDFNNLLTVIGGYSRMLLANEAAVPDKMLEPIRQIVQAADRASAITSQLLSFSRRRTTEPRNVQINNVVSEMNQMLQRLLGEHVQLVVSLDPTAGQIRADPTQIEQVLMNLAVNARDAMPSGGRLLIETCGILVDETLACRHVGLTKGDHVLLTVSDNGCGMSAEVQAHLFEPFFTTKPQGKGTGLGLSIVYGIVQQQGGKILVYSEAGRGTTFKMFFPRLADDERQSGAPASPVPRSGTETILVVEDEKGVRDYLRTVLGHLGYTLLVAADGAEAIEVASHHRGEISLLLSDVVMPQMNGPQLADRLRQDRPDLKVLFMSGYTERSLTGDIGPGSATIQKPFTPTAIAERVREMLDRA